MKREFHALRLPAEEEERGEAALKRAFHALWVLTKEGGEIRRVGDQGWERGHQDEGAGVREPPSPASAFFWACLSALKPLGSCTSAEVSMESLLGGFLAGRMCNRRP